MCYHQLIKEAQNKHNDEAIQQHINSFQLLTSHYCREHSPNKLYLTSDWSFTEMNRFLSKK